MYRRESIVRLRLWLETGEGMLFGAGRAELLEEIERSGSLKRAAQNLGISYRAAWGKLKQSERALGVCLIRKRSNRAGYQLTEEGLALTRLFRRWYAAVEQAALREARAIFPWKIVEFDERPWDEERETA
jgi:molybdate transport system regulatory protein